MVFYRYFSLQATMPLGFSDKIRFYVEQNICREDEKGPQPDCFDKPNKIVYNFLNKVHLYSIALLLNYTDVQYSPHNSYIKLIKIADIALPCFQHYLPAFLSSQLYYKYLSELISTVQSSPCPSLHPKIKRTG